MQVWAIVADHLKDSWEDEFLFEDRLMFIGANLDTVKDQLKQVIANPHELLASKWEIDYDGWKFLYTNGDFYDDGVFQIRLVHDSIKGSKYTYIYFRLLLLDLHKHSTAQTSIPDDVIQSIHDELIQSFPKD